MSTIINLVSVFKLRIAMAISLTAVAGMAVAQGPVPDPGEVAVLAVAVLLAAASAGAFNQLFEHELDALMARTRNRPFACGQWRPSAYWLLLVVFLLVLGVGSAASAFNAVAAAHVFLGAFVYGVVYTVWLKRRTVWNIVVGDLAGSFAVLAGAAAVDPTPNAASLILAVVLFLWTPPHFWSLAMVTRDDYAAAGVPMLPVVKGDVVAAHIVLAHALAVALLSTLPFLFGMEWLYLVAAVLGGSYFVATSVRLLRAPGRAAALVNFRASLIQLSTLILGATGDAWLLG